MSLVRVLFKEGQSGADGSRARRRRHWSPYTQFCCMWSLAGWNSLTQRASLADRRRNPIELGVGNGLRASMESGNLLTGAQYIRPRLSIPTAEEAALGTFMDYTTIPTIETGLAQLEEQVTGDPEHHRCAATRETR